MNITTQVKETLNEKGQKMSKLMIFFLTVFSILFLILGGARADNAVNPNPQVLTLDQLSENPTSFKDATVVFRGQFHRIGEVFSPFYTVFSEAVFINFSAWDFEAPIWVKSEFKSDFPYLYVDKRQHELCEAISTMPEFTRFEATGEVRSTFNNIPWIEVLSVRAIPGNLTRENIYHIARGFYYKDKGDHLNAVIEFSQAMSENLPLTVQIMVWKEQGKSLMTLESYQEAVDALNEALDLSNGDDKDTEFLLKEAEALMEYEEVLQEEYQEMMEEMEENRERMYEEQASQEELNEEEWVDVEPVVVADEDPEVDETVIEDVVLDEDEEAVETETEGWKNPNKE